MPNPVLDQERVEFLRARTVLRTALLPAWPRQNREMPLVEVDVDWVRFSTLNHRTRAEQLRASHLSKQPDLFTADPLGKDAQAAQYAILSQQEGFADLKGDLLERRQQEPAVISIEGVLINGNRRAAALRSLYHDDHVLDARYIQCLLLPDDATPDELVDLEAELQVARDFKEEYSWVNEALLIAELYEREGRSFAHVARKMHREESQVRTLYDKLQQLYQLVELSKGTRQLIDFKENESAFDELAKHIKSKPKPEQDSVRATYFLGTLAGVNYRTLRHLRRADAADLVYREISKNNALRPFLDAAASASPDMDAGSPLDDLLGQAPESNKLMGVLGYLAKRTPDEVVQLPGGVQAQVEDIRASIQSAISSAADEAEEEARDQTSVTSPISRIEEAITKVERASEMLQKARAIAGWSEERFQSKVQRLQTLVASLKTTAT